MYVYIKSEPGLWTVGFYDPKDNWIAESDHDSAEKAACRVAWLNGGHNEDTDDDQIPDCFGMHQYRDIG